MRVNKIVLFSVVMLLITAVFAGAVTVPAAAQNDAMMFRYNAQHTGDYSPVAASPPIKTEALGNAVVASGTTPSVQWNETFAPGSWGAQFFSIKQTTDGGYIAAGRATWFNASAPCAKNFSDGWLMKLDANGNKQWEKLLGDGCSDDFFYSVQQTRDGGYIAAGYSYSFTPYHDNRDAWLVKTDVNGNLQWENTFGKKALGYDDEAHSVQQTSDGGYILAGSTTSYGTNGDAWLIKTDVNGNELWNKTYGDILADSATSVQQTTDGGYVMSGVSGNGQGATGGWLVKTDASGVEQWQYIAPIYTASGTPDINILYSVQQTPDGYVAVGGTNYVRSDLTPGYEVYLVKVDTGGKEQWHQMFLTDGAMFTDGTSVALTVDGGFIITGFYNRPFTDILDGFLIKTDANGQAEWGLWLPAAAVGAAPQIQPLSVQQTTTDGGFILTGVQTDDNHAFGNGWVAKVGPDLTPTSLTLTPPQTSPYVNQPFLLTGSFTPATSGAPVATEIGAAASAQNITLQRSTNNVTWTNANTTQTTADGSYVFSQKENATGTYYYRTAYAGNDVYAPFTTNASSVTVLGGSWGAWTSLGGQILAGTSPAACSPGSGQTDWFVVGTNHQLYYTSTGGSSWTSLGGNLTSSPAATSPTTGVIDVFARGTNGALYTKHFSGGSWGAWTSLGGQIPAGTSPAACSWGASREDVFVEGTNGALYQNTWNGTSWSGWASLGGVLTSSPGATSPTSGVIDVFVRGTNGALYTKHYSGSWGAWTNLGGQIPAGTSPAACSWGASREDVFVEGTNGALYQNTWNGSGWSGWTNLGGVLTSSPAATSPASGTIDVGVRGTNGALYERIYTGG